MTFSSVMSLSQCHRSFCLTFLNEAELKPSCSAPTWAKSGLQGRCRSSQREARGCQEMKGKQRIVDMEECASVSAASVSLTAGLVSLYTQWSSTPASNWDTHTISSKTPLCHLTACQSRAKNLFWLHLGGVHASMHQVLLFSFPVCSRCLIKCHNSPPLSHAAVYHISLGWINIVLL